MRSDFCVFILTNRRPDRVTTYRTLVELCGYTGAVFLVIDDEDPTGDEYRQIYGDKVICFSKKEEAKNFDEANNFNDRRSPVYARNACRRLAMERGFRFYMQLDDDYNSFGYRWFHIPWIPIRLTMDRMLEELIGYLEATPQMLTIAMSQGGDHIGGRKNVEQMRMRRKAMNSFIADVERPLVFTGVLNDDVNTYVLGGNRGDLFFTVLQVQLNQRQTQANAGGLTEMYLDSGTYVKSFYTVMMAPSCVKIGLMGDHRNPENQRIHHVINWRRAVPKIVPESVRKPSMSEAD